jgi:hypothetical protein
VRRNPQHINLLTVVSATSAPRQATSATFERPWENFSTQSWTAYYATNTSHRKQETFLYEYPLHWVTHNRTLLIGRTILKHGRHFDYWNQPLNMRMRVCYLDCHEAGRCCYLVICIENLLRQLHLFYFNLWCVYWLPRIFSEGLCRMGRILICPSILLRTSPIRSTSSLLEHKTGLLM